jgi:hypothetical protein
LKNFHFSDEKVKKIWKISIHFDIREFSEEKFRILALIENLHLLYLHQEYLDKIYKLDKNSQDIVNYCTGRRNKEGILY